MKENKNTTPRPPIQLSLNIEEVNLVLKALGNLPFNEVFELIGNIHDQANSQTSVEIP